MDFRILGPLEVSHDGGVLQLPGAKARALLAILLLHPNQVVSTDHLIDELWGADPPGTALNTLQVYVSQLRKLLPAGAGSSREVLLTKSPGYLLRVGPGRLDSARFDELVAAGRKALGEGDPTAAVQAFRQADGLWRGPPLADVEFESFAQVEGRLQGERLSALEDLFEAELALGGHLELVGELETTIARHPFRERLRRQLMIALYRAGRQADALAAYQAARQVLVEELGIEPSPELQRLEKAVLAQDRLLDLPELPAAEPEPAQPALHPKEVRKSVSVLCAEVGSTGGDPEALGRSLDRFFDEGLALVSRHDGSGARLVGETLLAVFGVPTLHEDDALRAVRAATELRELVDGTGEAGPGVRLGVRIGIATGEVVTKDAGAGPADVTGEAVSGAARLARSGASGEILVSESTHRVIYDAVEVERFEAGGDSAWRLLELVAGAPSFRRRLDAPIVGRGAELTQLRQTFDRVVAERKTQLMTVLGPAGIGKSRLAGELRAAVKAEARVLVGRTLPYGEGITYWPLAEIIRQIIGDRGREAIAEIVAHERENDLTVARVAAAIGLSGGEGGTEEETFWAVRKLFEAVARERPLVLVFDDIHWAEPTLLDLIEHIVDWARDAPMLVVCLARPELAEERPIWGSARSNRASMFIEPLSDADSEALIDNLLDDVALGEHSRGRIIDAAEGNPLFIEQLLALVLGRGQSLEEISIPPTIQALLAARLDRLGWEERAVLECASVIGRDFWLEPLTELAPDDVRPALHAHIRELLHKELIRPGGTTTVTAGEAFSFRHILIRDAAYESTPKARRAELHERFADWLEHNTDSDGRLPEHEEIVGYHLEQAHGYLSDLGIVPERAREIAARAGELLAPAGRRADVHGDARSAASLLSRAVVLLPHDHSGRPEALVDLAEALTENSEFERGALCLDEVIRAAGGDRTLEARALIARVRIQLRSDPKIMLNDLTQAVENAIAVFEEAGDEVGLAKAWLTLGWLAWIGCRAATTEAALRKAIEHARSAGDARTMATCLHLTAGASLLGPMPVTDAARLCEEILSDRPNPRTAGSALRALAGLRAMQGSFEEARELFRQEQSILEDLGANVWSSSAWEARGIVEMLAGDAKAAESAFRRGYDISEQIGETSTLSTLAAMLAQAVYEQGRYEEALELAEISERTTAAEDLSTQVQWRGPSAKALARKGRKRKAESLAREAVALANDTDFLNFHAGALVDLAEVLRLGGRRIEAAAAMADAARLYEEKGNIVFAARARTLLRALGGEPGPSAPATRVAGTRKGA